MNNLAPIICFHPPPAASSSTFRILNCSSVHSLPTPAAFVPFISVTPPHRPLVAARTGASHTPVVLADSREPHHHSRTHGILIWLFRHIAVTSVGSRLSSPRCSRPLRSPPARLHGVTFNFPPSPNFWIPILGTCILGALNPDNPPWPP